MKKAFLIFVWAVFLPAAFFFLDIIVNYFLGYNTSYITGATTKASQVVLSSMMLPIIGLGLYLYTNILTQKQ
jgi:uncharacterized membrane protein